MQNTPLLSSIFNFHRGEGKNILLLWIHSFFKGLSLVFFETAANSFFLSQYSSEALPFIYIVVAIVSIMIGIAYSGIEKKTPPKITLPLLLVFSIVIMTISYLLLNYFPGRITVSAVMVLKTIVWIMANIEFWAIAGLTFDVRQGKRLFSLVSSGEIVAIILGGLVVSSIVGRIGSINIIFLSVFVMIISTIPLFILGKTVFSGSSDSSSERERKKKKSGIFSNKYMVLFSAATILSTLSYYFVDFIFFQEVEHTIKDVTSLAVFFGRFFAILGFINLIMTSFFSGRLITRFGLGIGLLFIPIADFLGLFSATITNIIAGVGVYFLLIVVTKIIDEIGRSSLESPAHKILYQPIPKAEMFEYQIRREAIVEPAAIGIAGGLILLFRWLFGDSVIQFAVVTVILLGVLAVISMLLRKEYTTVLIGNLSKDLISKSSIEFRDKESIAILYKNLESSRSNEVLFCIKLLVKSDREGFRHHIEPLLNHADVRVRYYISAVIEKKYSDLDPSLLYRRIEQEKNRKVLGRLIQTLGVIDGDNAFELIESFLAENNGDIKAGAIVTLLRDCGIDGMLIAVKELDRLMKSSSIPDRILAARIFGKIGNRNYYRSLIHLLTDEQEPVIKASLQAAGNFKSRKLLPYIINHLSKDATRYESVKALVKYGIQIMPSIQDIILSPDSSVQIKRSLIYVIGKLRSEKVVPELMNLLGNRSLSVSLRTSVLKKITSYRYQAGPGERSMVIDFIRHEASLASYLYGTLVDVKGLKINSLFQVIKAQIKDIQTRIFYLLYILSGKDAILRARQNYFIDYDENRILAVEVLDNIIPVHIKQIIFPILEPMDLNERIEQLENEFPVEYLGEEKRILQLISEKTFKLSPSFTALIMYAAVKNSLAAKPLEGLLKDCLTSVEPIIRQTAIWGLYKMNPEMAEQFVRKMIVDSDRLVRMMAERLHDNDNNDSIQRGYTMLLTVEKIILLKSVEIFSGISEDFLHDIALHLKELRIKKGEMILKKGELGTSLFIVIKGRVKIHDGDREISVIGEHDVFGEMSSLDPEPRSASATALENTILFTLEGDVLYELMEISPAVTKQIIQILCQRIRNVTQTLGEK